MRKYAAILLALFLLTGCRAPAGESSRPTESGTPGTPRPTASPTVTESPAFTAEPTPAVELTSTPEPEPASQSPFGPLPVTEEGIWDYYLHEEKGYYIIRNITPYEGDYLVELGRDYEGETLLVWIFGDTGRKVQMTTMENRTETEIQGRGVLRVRTGGKDTGKGWMSLPGTYIAVAPAVGDYADAEEKTTWMDPGQSYRMGMFSERYEQLCDARVDAEGLSFSFIPDTESMERFQSFFPACTSTPGFETTFDEAAGTFTLRLYNTSLKSDSLTKEMAEWIGGYQDYGDLYPRTIPEGSLGADNLFLAGVAIRQEGEDAVVTAKLTDRAGWFTVESGNLGYDDVPWLRFRFREPDSMEAEYRA